MIRRQRSQASKSASDNEVGHWLEHLALGSATALIVLSTLVPSEDAVHGSGAFLAAAWMFVLLLVQLITWYGIIKPRFGWPDAIILLLAIWMIASSAVMAWKGNPRQTLNALWQWEAILAGYWACRQLFTTARRLCWLLAIMISLVVGISAHGVYQYFVGIPHFITEYQNANDFKRWKILSENGIDPHSPMVRSFEDRLRSREVYATFVLANSLAGVVTPWLIVLLAWQLRAPSSTRIEIRIALAVASLLVLGCLVLTKSRSAWVAFAVGLLGLAIIHRRSLLRQHLVLIFAGVALLIVIAVAVVSGALDRQILTEAWLSLSYRLQYWQAAMQMTLAHPLFGCGPGNFQEYYALYKLPVSSETVADPHNFLLEIAATAGIPAALLMLLLLGVWFKSLILRHEAKNHSPQPVDGKPTSLFVGALIGGLLAIAYGWLTDFSPESDPWFGIPILLCLDIPVAAVVLAALYRLDLGKSNRSDWRPVLAIAVIVLLVNLLAAGGISYLSVSQSLWLLIALTLNDAPHAPVNSGRNFALVGLIISGALLVASIVTGSTPVLESKPLLDMARSGSTNTADPEHLDRARQSALQAAKSDRWSAEPWQVLSQIDLTRGLLGESQALEDFENDVQEARRRNRHAQALEVNIGIQYLYAYQRGGLPTGLEKSLAAFERAAELYPNSNYIHSQLAWVAHLAGQSKLASEHADRALTLDAINPHWEQKLKQQRIQDFGAPQDTHLDQPDPSRVDAEQIAVWLRNLYDSGDADSGGTR